MKWIIWSQIQKISKVPMILDILILALILQIVIHCINHKLKLSIFISDQTPWFEGPTIKESELFSETKKRVRWELGVIRMILKLHLIFLLSLHSCNVTECYCFTRNMRVTFLFLLVCVAASLAIHIGVKLFYELYLNFCDSYNYITTLAII